MDISVQDQIKLKFKNGAACPHCGSGSVNKFGFFNGKQRYRCKECKKTFNLYTKTLLSWSHYKDKWEAFIETMLMAFTPFFYLLSKSMLHIVLLSVISGSAISGTTLLLLNNLYEVVPDSDRTTYIAFYTIMTNITLMFAPILGMKLKSATNIYFALFIVGVLRILSSIAFYIRYRKYSVIKPAKEA